MSVAIMTDTNSGISPAEGEQYGICVVSMPIIIDDEEFFEYENITGETLFNEMNCAKEVRSSQPSIGYVLEMWEKLLNDYDEVVYIPMSSGLSGSYDMSNGIAADFNNRVYVADSHRISVTLYEAVFDALYMSRKGYCGEKIKDEIEKSAYMSSIYIAVNSLEYLKKSGRVTPAGAAVANVLNIKPVLTIQGEKLDAYSKVRSMKQAENRMLQAIQNDIDTRFRDIPANLIRIGAAGTFQDKTKSGEWLKMAREAFPYYDVYYQQLPCSIASHVGCDSAGIGVSVINHARIE